MRNSDDLDSFFKDRGVKKMQKSFGKIAIFAIAANLAIFLGTIAGVCWIVKYFFFS